MRNLLFAAIATLLLSGGVCAQAPQLSCLVCGQVPRGQGYKVTANRADQMEPAWTASFSGGLSLLTNIGTNDGFLASTALRLAQHWNARADIFSVSSTGSIIALIGPEYMFSLAHLIKPNDFFNTTNIQPFFNVKFGDDRLLGQSKFAYAIGGGFSVIVSPTLTIRPLDVSYVRSSLLQHGGIVLGNHLQYASSIGFNF